MSQGGISPRAAKSETKLKGYQTEATPSKRSRKSQSRARPISPIDEEENSDAISKKAKSRNNKNEQRDSSRSSLD